jgi:endonuclease V-like protein UPF0215 family
VARLREAIRRQLEDNRLRIKTYTDIVKSRIRGKSEELYALLSGVRSSTTESNRETGVLGEEVRDKERGHTDEDTGESNI